MLQNLTQNAQLIDAEAVTEDIVSIPSDRPHYFRRARGKTAITRAGPLLGAERAGPGGVLPPPPPPPHPPRSWTYVKIRRSTKG